MTDMQQILAGKNELNERVQNADVRATEAERQALATRHELARSQAGLKGKGEECSSATATAARDWRVCVEVLATPVRRRGRQVERTGSCFFAVGLGDFLVARWQNTLRDTVTIQQTSWTWRSRH